MTTFGFDKIILYSDDPRAVSEFYTRAAGLSFDRVEGTERYESVSDAKGTRIVIEAARPPLPRGRRECALSFCVSGIEAIAMRMREDGLDFGPILERPTGKFAALVDPDGRNVELWEPRASAARVEPPALVDKPAEVAPPPLVETPAEVPPPAFVDKPADVAPPPLVETPDIASAPAESSDKPAEAAEENAAPNDDKPAEASAEAPPPPPPMVTSPGPMITAARPTKFSMIAGGRLTLFGANFNEDCTVLIDGKPCPDISCKDAFTLDATLPPHPPGIVRIVVDNGQGGRAAIDVSYAEGPVIERFTPLEGSPRGGTEVVVEGRNFDKECRITFFANRAPEVIFESEKRLRFVTPPQDDLFHGELRVTNPDGLLSIAPDIFTYRLATPHIEEVSPATGLVAGDKRITITGVDFHPKCKVKFGSTEAIFTWKSPTTLDVITPRVESPGVVNIVIENPDGQVVTKEGAFKYDPEPTPPLLVEVRPSTGFCQGGQLIYLLGENFDAQTVVRIGEVRAISRTRSRKEIEVELPPRHEPGVVAVELTDKDGIVVRREDAFTYMARPAPRVDSVTPRNGPMVGGTKLVIEGEYFDQNCFLRIGGQAPKHVVVRGATMIETIAPPSRTSGFVDVEIGRGDSGVSVAKNAYRYDPSPAPMIESVSPNKGTVDGGTEVAIEGKNFVADSIVLFAGKSVGRVKFVSSTSLEVKSPAGKNGDMVDVVVRNPDGKEATAKRAFMYDARYRS
ncbi:MAG: IPT/TIG domain-containing protein [Polyangiaceae bacterium]|nr:IPT/TIG domain-containing protein [Polyangiaceae bacterium]